MTRWIVVFLLAGSLVAVGPSPAAAAGDASRQVSAGGVHTCELRASGRLWCWGDDSDGELGNGPPSAGRHVPVQVAGSRTDWAAVSAGHSHTCALRTSGRLFCWGDDEVGQLGNGAPVQDRNVPVEVAGAATDWVAVSAGIGHTCGLKRNGRLYCWGYDRHGQLGNGGANARRLVPSPVAGNATWAQVSASYDHTCAIRRTGRLFCWGADAAGQLGNGATSADQGAPVPVGGATDWMAVSAGVSHTCGLRRPGRLFCWGADDAGQVGNGGPGTNDQLRPVPVLSGLTNWTAVTSGAGHSCARLAGGHAYCWGWDANGQLGNGTPNNDESVPVEVFGNRPGWAQIDAGYSHTCARRGTGSLFCWGVDGKGQLGDDEVLADQPSPVEVS